MLDLFRNGTMSFILGTAPFQQQLTIVRTFQEFFLQLPEKQLIL